MVFLERRQNQVIHGLNCGSFEHKERGKKKKKKRERKKEKNPSMATHLPFLIINTGSLG